MASFYPKKEETRLVTLPERQFLSNLSKFIRPIDRQDDEGTTAGHLFNGIWSRENFSISLVLRISNNFIPIIRGQMVSSEEGILVHLQYDMFPATKKLLLFWTVLTFLLTVFFIGIYQAWLYGAISFGFCIVNYILVRENFKIQVRKSQRMVEKLFSYTEE